MSELKIENFNKNSIENLPLIIKIFVYEYKWSLAAVVDKLFLRKDLNWLKRQTKYKPFPRTEFEKGLFKHFEKQANVKKQEKAEENKKEPKMQE